MSADPKQALSVETVAATQLLAEYHGQVAEDDVAKVDLIEGQTGLFEAVDVILARLAMLEDHMEAIVAHGRKLNDRNSRYREQHEKLRRDRKSVV